MKAITVHQPWATLIAVRAKRIETRSWPTSHRGLVAIHAAKPFPLDIRGLCSLEPFAGALASAGYHGQEGNLPLGAVVAVAYLADCRRIHVGKVSDAWISGDTTFLPTDQTELAFGDFTPGRWMWFLSDVRRLSRPIPCRGQQGLWSLPEVARLAVAEAGGVEVGA